MSRSVAVISVTGIPLMVLERRRCNTDSLSTDKKHHFNIDITQEMLAAAGGSVSITVLDAESKDNLDEVIGGAFDPTRFTLVNLSNINTVLSSQVVASGTDNGKKVDFTVTIALGLESNGLPTTPNLKLSNLLNDDQGEFYAPGTTPPAFCKQHDPNNPTVLIPATNNSNGAVVVNLNAPLAFATNPGVPTNSYGFIRFRVRVN